VEKTGQTWAMLGACKDGDDVLGIWTYEPSLEDRHAVILRLPLYVYTSFRVNSYGPKSRIPNHRTKAGRMKDVRNETGENL
jgi:hypothetical protein